MDLLQRLRNIFPRRRSLHDCSRRYCKGDYYGDGETGFHFKCSRDDCKALRTRVWDRKRSCWLEPEEWLAQNEGISDE